MGIRGAAICEVKVPALWGRRCQTFMAQQKSLAKECMRASGREDGSASQVWAVSSIALPNFWWDSFVLEHFVWDIKTSYRISLLTQQAWVIHLCTNLLLKNRLYTFPYGILIQANRNLLNYSVNVAKNRPQTLHFGNGGRVRKNLNIFFLF